ncbi:hypothetical protein CWS02_10680 [Enterobacter sp. EA-1]|nr:hypothetical protein CWS02_10680 [Enterobacter sp. EA-1]
MPRFITYPLSEQPATQSRLVLDRLKDAALADGQSTYRATPYAEIVRYAPDALILSRQCSPFLQEWLQRLRKIAPVFTVFDIDEYLPALPTQSPLREKFPADLQHAARDRSQRRSPSSSPVKSLLKPARAGMPIFVWQKPVLILRCGPG